MAVQLCFHLLRQRQMDKDQGKMKGHDDWIASLCELSGNKLISGSNDHKLKVWNISNDSLIPIKTLEGHDDNVYQVISLTKDIIAFGSVDQTIKIWDTNKYKEIQTLQEDFDVYSLLKLKNKDRLVASGKGKSVSF